MAGHHSPGADAANGKAGVETMRTRHRRTGVRGLFVVVACCAVVTLVAVRSPEKKPD